MSFRDKKKTMYVENSIEFMKSNIDGEATLHDLTSRSGLSKPSLPIYSGKKQGIPRLTSLYG